MIDFTAAVIRVTKTRQEFTFRQIAVLLICAAEPDPVKRQVVRLASALENARPVISRAADRLEEAGLISRSTLPGDKRTCVISVTPAGREFISYIVQQTSKKRAA